MKSKINWFKVITVFLSLLTIVVVILLYFAMKDRWKDEAAGYTVTEEEFRLHEAEGRYYYSQLSEDEKRLYIEILGIIKGCMSDVVVSTKDPELLQKICIYVECDYPDIFYTDGFSYKNSYKGGVLKNITLVPKYTMEKSEIEEKQEKIRLCVNKCLQGISKDASDYEKAKYVYDYIINNTRYVENCAYNQNICSVFLNGESVCQGYAKATQYLLNELGIEATIVSGYSLKDAQPHAWNLLSLDGLYYYLDATWGDGLNADAGADDVMAVSYDFLNFTTEDLNNYMKVDEVVSLPVCDSMEHNYYVENGNYFTSVDEKQLAEMFDKAYEDGLIKVTFKCADKTVYDKMLTYLLTEENIFNFLKDKSTITYIKSEEMRTVSFMMQ